MADHGEPAFPHPDPQGPGPHAVVGMSMRDYFAAQAFIVIGVTLREADKRTKAESLASAAYQIADAMMAERLKK